MNICRPDSHKSCVACCGLYNVNDATKPSLEEKLLVRTDLFEQTERSCEALTDFRDRVSRSESSIPLDPVIHVCEFVGFLDDNNHVVGCMLHPTTRGNRDIDLRGLCHYGSMACRMFYCPSWSDLPEPIMLSVCEALHDWHLYGLVITDGDFLRSIFKFMSNSLDVPIVPDILLKGRQGELFREILSWKDAWPFKGDSLIRKNRYHFRFDVEHQNDPIHGILSAIENTFGIDRVVGSEEYVRGKLLKLINCYKYCY